tara:strand:+ start:1602 stop:2615 length:1014 start_codon:yes stop_codon:yes gene_type:complete
MTKKALITGISGQDGAYLAQHLLNNNYEVFGGERHTASGSLWRLDDLKIIDDVKIQPFELSEYSNIKNVIQTIEPDEIYNLAAQSFVASSFNMPLLTSDVTGLGVMRILEAIKEINKDIKFYQASSSEMFGKVQSIPQNENTMFYPRSPYAVAKLFGHWATVNHRESYGIFSCSGILFNHESPLRGENFVTKKITSSLCRIKKKKQTVLELGNLDSRRDWGYAGDYVQAMHLMLQQEEADDYVIATGIDASVRDFIEYSCELLDISLSWEGEGIKEIGIDSKTGKTIIKINPEYYRPAEVDTLLGDASKAKKILNWSPKTNLKDLVKMMIEYDLSHI